MDCIGRMVMRPSVSGERESTFLPATPKPRRRRVIRAFAKMREALLASPDLARKLAALEKKLTGRLDVHEAAIVKVLQDLMQILNPPPLPPDPPQRKIGF